jgi:hypothetical protein
MAIMSGVRSSPLKAPTVSEAGLMSRSQVPQQADEADDAGWNRCYGQVLGDCPVAMQERPTEPHAAWRGFPGGTVKPSVEIRQRGSALAVYAEGVMALSPG